jgi:hypothetical protein
MQLYIVYLHAESDRETEGGTSRLQNTREREEAGWMMVRVREEDV